MPGPFRAKMSYDVQNRTPVRRDLGQNVRFAISFDERQPHQPVVWFTDLYVNASSGTVQRTNTSVSGVTALSPTHPSKWRHDGDGQD